MVCGIFWRGREANDVAGRINVGMLALSSTVYFAFYSLFTAAIQFFTISDYGVAGLSFRVVEVSSQLYTGPALQIVAGSVLVMLRILPAVLATVLAVVFGFNVSIIWRLYRLRALRSCLLGGAGGGVGSFVASLASFSYLCCGWAASLLVFAGGLVASLGVAASLGAIAFLTLNAVILSRRSSVQVPSR